MIKSPFHGKTSLFSIVDETVQVLTGAGVSAVNRGHLGFPCVTRVFPYGLHLKDCLTPDGHVLLRWVDEYNNMGERLRAKMLEMLGTDIFALLPLLEGTLDGYNYRVVGADDPSHDAMLEKIEQVYGLGPTPYGAVPRTFWYTQLESPHEKHPYLAPSVVYIPKFRDLPLQLTLSRPRASFTSHEELEAYLTSVRRLKEWFATLERILA